MSTPIVNEQGFVDAIETAAGTWRTRRCGCCNGLEWGGEYPCECRTCAGNGVVWISPSGTRIALYPGGPFMGRA